MTIDRKIIGGYAIVLALLALVTGVAFYSLKGIDRAYGGFLDRNAPAIVAAMELKYEARDQVAQYRGLLLYPEQRARLATELRESHRQLDTVLDRVRGLAGSAAATGLVDDIAELQKKYREGQEQGIRLLEEGQRDQAIVLSEEVLLPVATALRDACDRYIDLQQKQLAEGRSEVARILNRTFLLLSSLSALAIVLGLAFGTLLTRSIVRQLRESVAQLSSSSAEILATTTQVAAGAAETATAVSETTVTVEEVKQTAQVSSQKAKYVSESAQKAAQVSQTGRGSVQESIQGMQRIQEQMASIAESVVRLSEQSQAIGEIIASVDDLAEQSNLTAVNAAIEAARAGEQGKGFAVVAQEVRSLAEQSKQATGRVRAILTDIQKATGAAVLATEQGGKAVAAGLQQSGAAGEAIRLLAESIAEAAQAATQIAASAQQQMAGMDQVALAMANIDQASAQNVAGTQQAEVAAQQLHELGQRLESMIGGQADGGHFPPSKK